MKKFWMVYRLDGGAPTKQHATRYAAEVEANRLIRCNPAAKFAVLEATALHYANISFHAADLSEQVGENQ